MFRNSEKKQMTIIKQKINFTRTFPSTIIQVILTLEYQRKIYSAKPYFDIFLN